jgi:predicted nucleic acid-binding protein
MIAVDTNVLIYGIDVGETSRHPIAVELLKRLVQGPEETVLLWQVAGEFLAHLRPISVGRRIRRRSLVTTLLRALAE